MTAPSEISEKEALRLRDEAATAAQRQEQDVARLARDPSFARSARFVTYHALGLLDFAVAVAAASLASGAFPALVSGPVTAAPMEVWPLVLFPSFIVPIFIILHLVVFLQVRALRRAADHPTRAAWQAA